MRPRPSDLDPNLVEGAEEHLITEAARFDAVGLKKLGRRLLEVVDQDAADAHEAKLLEKEERDAQAAMRLTMYDDGHGKVHGRFVLDAFTGAALRKMVLAIAAPKHHAASGPLGERKPTAERMGRAFGELINKLLEAGGCQVDGCDAPPGLTHLHHKIEWSQGGRTDLDNTIMICAPHHARAHDPTYQLTPIPGDKFTFHRRT